MVSSDYPPIDGPWTRRTTSAIPRVVDREAADSPRACQGPARRVVKCLPMPAPRRVKVPSSPSAPASSRRFSSAVVDGPARAAGRAMLHAVGFTRADFAQAAGRHRAPPGARSRPATCTSTSSREHAAAGVDGAGGKAVIFNTITVSDGISMGTEGMKYSLVSREVIADSIETVVGAEGFDGLVAIGGCDKNMPGCAMAMARLNRPAVFVYGGTILPGI